MVVARQSYFLIYTQVGWATAMQESFCGAFLEKRQRIPPASLRPQHPTMNYNYIKTPSAFGVVNSDAESAFQRKHFIR